MIKAAFMGFSMLERALAILGLVAMLAGILWGIHHKIYKSGYNDAMGAVAAANAERLANAQKAISKIGERHEKIRQSNRAHPAYNAPACPLAAAALDRLPKRATKPRK